MKQNARVIIQQIATQLKENYDIREAESIAEILLEDAFEISRNALFLNEKIDVDDSKLIKYLERLKKNEPIQYVVGKTYFYGYEFGVKSGVLIPRPETEELVDWMIQENEQSAPRILDIGTGSGCIAITLNLKLGGKTYAIDVSTDALNIAKANNDQLNANVIFQQLDILQEKPSLEKLDCIVSNPPYIPNSDREKMSENVLNFEPEKALFVANHEPLIFYRTIAELAKELLLPNGKLYFEIHEEYGNEVVELMKKLGFSDVTLKKDMQGKDRMVRGNL